MVFRTTTRTTRRQSSSSSSPSSTMTTMISVSWVVLLLALSTISQFIVFCNNGGGDSSHQSIVTVVDAFVFHAPESTLPSSSSSSSQFVARTTATARRKTRLANTNLYLHNNQDCDAEYYDDGECDTVNTEDSSMNSFSSSSSLSFMTNDSTKKHRHPSRRHMISRSLHAAAATTAALFFTTPPPPSYAATSTPSLSEEYRQGTAALADMNEDTAPVPREAYKKLPSGVIYADLRTTTKTSTDVVQQGSRVNLQWVLRKSNGYFVDSSQTNDSVPFIFTVGDGTAIQGVDEGVRGMTVGGVRRLLIPPSLAYVDGLEDGKPGPLPVGFGPRQQMRRVQNIRKDVPGEYIYLEVQVTKIR